MARFALESLGCKLNQAEIEALSRELVRRGHELVDTVECADAYVLNTCTVTHVADRKSRHALRMARGKNPCAIRVALGCYARRAPGDLLRPDIADRILTSREVTEIAGALENADNLGQPADFSSTISRPARTRSFIKVQDGCTSFCSFCIVPHVRIPESSRPMDVVLQEIKTGIDSGVREIVLTGTRIGNYRSNGLQSGDLAALVRSVLRSTRVPRLRLSSLGPHDLSTGMLKLWAEHCLCPHLHLPLQSGSDSILRRMNRPYSLSEYVRSVERARQMIPDLAVTTDILVGFPGETEKDFEESCDFCTRMGFAGIHVFTFSPRAGTTAYLFPDQIDERIKKERSIRMLSLSAQSARDFRHRFIGRNMEVLWEKKDGRNIWNGLTRNYMRVFAESDEDLSGRLLPARLMAVHSQGLVGQLVHGGGNG